MGTNAHIIKPYRYPEHLYTGVRQGFMKLALYKKNLTDLLCNFVCYIMSLLVTILVRRINHEDKASSSRSEDCRRFFLKNEINVPNPAVLSLSAEIEQLIPKQN